MFQGSLPMAEHHLRSLAAMVQRRILIRSDTFLPAMASVGWCGSASPWSWRFCQSFVYCWHRLLTILPCSATSSRHCFKNPNFRTTKRHSRHNSTSYIFVSSAALRLPPAPPTYSYLLHQIPGMVVLTGFPRSLADNTATRPSHSPSQNASSTPKRNSNRWYAIRTMSHMWWSDQQCYSTAIRICVLLSVRVWACWETREVSCYVITCQGVAAEEGDVLILISLEGSRCKLSFRTVL